MIFEKRTKRIKVKFIFKKKIELKSPFFLFKN